MIKRILFLTMFHFSQRDFNRFGVELLKKEGFKVEVWDVADILYPGIIENDAATGQNNRSGYEIFVDKNRLVDKLKKLGPDTFVIPTFHYNLKTYYIYRAISAGGAGYASFMAGGPGMAKGRAEKLLVNILKLQRDPLKKIIDHCFRRIPFGWLGIKPCSLVFATGKKTVAHINDPNDSSTEIVWIHDWDYDHYLEEKDRPCPDQPIAVFLDQYLPFHPDSEYRGERFPRSADKYYSLLNGFFRLVESQLGLEVIIASHPQSQYEKHPEYFEGRRHLKGRTIELVKQGRLVLAHFSKSVAFASLFYKPIIFLTSRELNECSVGQYIKVLSREFGKDPILLGGHGEIDWKRELTVNRVHYDGYRQNYIKKTNSLEAPFWEIAIDRLKKGF